MALSWHNLNRVSCLNDSVQFKFTINILKSINNILKIFCDLLKYAPPYQNRNQTLQQ